MSKKELDTEMNGGSLDVSEQKERELAQLFPLYLPKRLMKKVRLLAVLISKLQQ